MSDERPHMTVRRVHAPDESGSHIEPPLGESWGDLEKLRWKAAVVEHDSGLRVRVTDGGSQRRVRGEWVPVPGTYSIQVGAVGLASFGFDDAWTFLSGVCTGAQQQAALKGEM